LISDIRTRRETEILIRRIRVERVRLKGISVVGENRAKTLDPAKKTNRWYRMTWLGK
jgi:hypothetical protein